MPLPLDIIDNDVQQIVNDMVAFYEADTGKTLQPAQVERLIFNAAAYRESLIRGQIQYALSQCLVDYADAPMLDYLGQLVGVNRLAASRATVDITFELVVGHGGVTIPVGTRIATQDGTAVFRTIADFVVLPGINTVAVECECTEEGAVGNNRQPGTITEILDPQAFLSTATNLAQSGGGAAQESDDELRERIKLAPGSFSNAGSTGAYKYWARTASPAIIDVQVLGPPTFTEGEVHIFPLMADGSVTQPTVLNAVYEACNADKVRPLTDLVIVTAPTLVDYEIHAELTIYTDADAVATQAAVLASLGVLITEKRQKLGQDVTLARVTQAAMLPGVYDVALKDEDGNPFTSLIIGPTEYAYCMGLNVTIVGTTNG